MNRAALRAARLPLFLLVGLGVVAMLLLRWSDHEARRRLASVVDAVTYLADMRRDVTLAYLAAEQRDDRATSAVVLPDDVAPATAILDRARLSLEDWRASRPRHAWLVAGREIDPMLDSALAQYDRSLLAMAPRLAAGTSRAARRVAFAESERAAAQLSVHLDALIAGVDDEHAAALARQLIVLLGGLLLLTLVMLWAFRIRARALADAAEREAGRQEAQRLEAIGTLAGGIAHDFNNVLAAMQGHLELARSAGASPTADAHLLDVEVAIRRAADLVRQILVFGRRADTAREPIGLGQVVADSVRLLRATLPPTLRIDVDAPQTDASDIVLADGAQLHQIVMNLVINAAQAMHGRGTVRLTVARREGPQPHDASARPWVCLSVSDDGPGIPADVLPRIFEPFYTTKGVGEGTGLGLSVVHGIVDAHGGLVQVDSTPDVGTRFDVLLPAAPPEEAVPTPPIATPAPTTTGLRVLLVDDEPAILAAVQRNLVRLGHEVAAFGDPLEALGRLRADAIDVLLTDLSMPAMDGRHLIREARAARPALPCVLMTGYGDGGAALPDGVEVLAKPFRAAELDALLRRMASPT